MNNDDCAAICPKCGRTTFLALLTDNKGTIHTISIHCRECGWDENWKQEEGKGFVKQPAPPKITRNIFMIEYTNSDPSFPHDVDRLDGEKIHELLKNNTRPCIDVKIETFDPKEWEITKIPEIPDSTTTEIRVKYTPEKEFSGFPDQEGLQPPKPEIEKNCETCGWNYIICRNPKDCHARVEWKPIEEETYGVCIQCGWKIRPFKKNLWCLVCRGEIKEVKKKEPESHE